MANPLDNLKRFGDGSMTPEEEYEIRAKGGRAAAASRRRKKTLRELSQVMLGSELPVKQKKQVLAMFPDLEDEELTAAALILAGQIQSAAKGNANAFMAICALDENAIQQTEADDALTAALKKSAESL